MSENEIVEMAKATTEVAKVGAKAIDATSGFGRFCDRVFGDAIEHGFGIVSDRIKYVRVTQALKLIEKVTSRLEQAGVVQTRAVSPVIALPIFEAATLEEDDELHTAWANLLATAMDPKKQAVKRSFAGILAELEPFDVRVLNLIMQASRAHNHRRDISFGRRNLELNIDAGVPLRAWFNVEGGFGGNLEVFSEDSQKEVPIDTLRDETENSRNVEVSINILFRVGILTFGVVGDYVLRHDGRQPSSFHGIEEFSVTALGIEFFESVAD